MAGDGEAGRPSFQGQTDADPLVARGRVARGLAFETSRTPRKSRAPRPPDRFFPARLGVGPAVRSYERHDVSVERLRPTLPRICAIRQRAEGRVSFRQAVPRNFMPGRPIDRQRGGFLSAFVSLKSFVFIVPAQETLGGLAFAKTDRILGALTYRVAHGTSAHRRPHRGIVETD